MVTINVNHEEEDEPNPFFSETNLAHLRKAEQQIRDGRVVMKTMEELEMMETE